MSKVTGIRFTIEQEEYLDTIGESRPDTVRKIIDWLIVYGVDYGKDIVGTTSQQTQHPRPQPADSA